MYKRQYEGWKKADEKYQEVVADNLEIKNREKVLEEKIQEAYEGWKKANEKYQEAMEGWREADQKYQELCMKE